MSALAAQAEGEVRTTPRSRKGVRTKARLRDAAKEIFEERGFLDTRVSDISERAGLSHGAFYHYFDSKEQIFREVAKEVDDRLSEPMNSVILAPGSETRPRERIRIAIHRHLVAYREEARIMRVIEQVARYDDDVFALRTAAATRHCQQIADSIRRLQERRLADSEIDPEIAAAALAAMIERFAEMWLAQGQLDRDFEQMADTVATVFANGLGLKGRTVVRLRGDR